MDDRDDWDTTKENIQPLKQGRSISASLFADIVDPKHSAELQAKRHELDETIAKYEGDDPLSHWMTLINWVEASYPKGGTQGGLSQLVKNCCLKFYQDGKETKKYFNDERFVLIWLKLAAVGPVDTLQTFEWMQKHGIGTDCPAFYISWAEELESMRNSTEAERILDLGLTACSENACGVMRLQNAKNTILDRDARSFFASGISSLEEEMEERSVLGGLRPVGQEKKQAPINRIGPNKIDSKPVLQPRDMSQRNKNSGPSISVLETENDGKSSTRNDEDLHACSLMAEFPFLLTEGDRENLVIEKLKVTRRFRSALTTKSTSLTFKIMSDPDMVNPKSKPKAERLPLDRRTLSVRAPTLKDDDGKAEPSCAGIWSEINYHDPSPSFPVLSSQLEPEPLEELAPGPQPCQSFQWAYERYPSGCREVSFEEGLATRWRKKCAMEATALQQKQEETIETLLYQTQLNLAEAEKERLAAESLRVKIETEHLAVLEDRKAMEAELTELRSSRAAADDIQRMAEEELDICEAILRGMTASLGGLVGDVHNADIPLVDVIQNFAQDVHGRLVEFNQERGNIAPTNMLFQVVEPLLAALEVRRVEDTALPETDVRTEEDNFDHVLPIASAEAYPTSQQTAYSWQSSQPVGTLPSGHVTDPAIKDLWNQTTMNMTDRDAGDVSDGDDSRSDSQSNSEEANEPSVPPAEITPPVRQTLGIRKPAKVTLRTSSVADRENIRNSTVPESDHLEDTSGKTPSPGLRIFADGRGSRLDPISVASNPCASTSSKSSAFAIFRDASVVHAHPASLSCDTSLIQISTEHVSFKHSTIAAIDDTNNVAVEAQGFREDANASFLDLFQADITTNDRLTIPILPVPVGNESLHHSLNVSRDPCVPAEESYLPKMELIPASDRVDAQASPSDLILLMSQPVLSKGPHPSFASLRVGTEDQLNSSAASTGHFLSPLRNSVISIHPSIRPVWRDVQCPAASPIERMDQSPEHFTGRQLTPKPESPMITCPVTAIDDLVRVADLHINDEMQPVNFGDDENCLPEPGRKSFVVSDMIDEFNFTRKSMGFGDQTIQPGTEMEFIRAISSGKGMASTPKPNPNQMVIFHDETEDDGEESRGGLNAVRQTRPSHGYGLGNAQLSPIIERSRESKMSSSSGSSCTTNLRTDLKKCTTNYWPLEERQEEEFSINPYDPELMAKFKVQLQDRFTCDSAVINSSESVGKIVPGKSIIKMNKERYKVEDELGKGNFATVYSVRGRSNATNTWALKVQLKEGWWDYYIHTEAIRRLQAREDSEQCLQHIIRVEQFQRLNDGGSYCFLPLFMQGTLVKLVNAFQHNSTDKTVPELLSMKLAIDILRAVEGLHSVNIIHGDIKSDNFLLHDMKDLLDVKSGDDFLKYPLAVLTDFGCGIDLDLLAPTVNFDSVKKGKTTAGFEILNSRPWTFQVDFLGILDTLHSLLFGEYMKVYEEAHTWKITRTFKRNWSPVWLRTFQKLLNATSEHLPSLADVRQDFEEESARIMEGTDFEKFKRLVRINVFMQRKSCFVGK